MRRLNLILSIFFLIIPILARAEEVSLTPDEAIAIALRSNPDILLKSEDVKKAKLKITEDKAGFSPTLNFTGGWTDTRGSYSKDLVQTTAQSTLKQYLYKGGKTINTLKQNQGKLEVVQELLDKTKLETILSVKKAFYTLLFADEFAGLNKGILENAQAHLDFIRQRYASGEVSESEVFTLEAALANVKQAYEASLNQAESSLALLRSLLFLDEGVEIKPAGEFIYQPREVAFDEAFLKAMRARPEIKQYAAQEEVDKKAIEITKADNRPSVYASWDYYSRSHLSGTTTKNWNDYNVVGLNFSWPIFDGWATKAKVEQAIVDLKETQLTKGKTIKDIALELKEAYLDLKNALAKINFRQVEVDLYKDKYKVAKEKYQAGIISALDLDDVSLGYKVALFNHRQGIYDYLVAKARFEKATACLPAGREAEG